MAIVLFILGAASVAASTSVMYGVAHFLRSDRQLRKVQRERERQTKQTLIDISTTVKDLKNADTNAIQKEILRELQALRLWAEKYH